MFVQLSGTSIKMTDITIKTEGIQREERYNYPLGAIIREIVLNMIVHRNYRDSSDSVIL